VHQREPHTGLHFVHSALEQREQRTIRINGGRRCGLLRRRCLFRLGDEGTEVVSELLQRAEHRPGLRGVGTGDDRAARLEHVAQLQCPASRAAPLPTEPQLDALHAIAVGPCERFERLRAFVDIALVDLAEPATLERSRAHARKRDLVLVVEAGEMAGGIYAVGHQRKKSRGSRGSLLDSSVRRMR
jgi:hypothetical protein